MYCPNCGKTNSRDQKFCRSCGLSLEKALQSLIEQLPAADINENLRERQRKVELWATIFGAGAIALLVLAILWAIIYKIIIIKGEMAEGLGFLAFILGLIVFALLMLYRESLVKSSKRPLPDLASAPSADTARQLPEPSFEPIPSVTEGSTEILTAERKRRGE